MLSWISGLFRRSPAPAGRTPREARALARARLGRVAGKYDGAAQNDETQRHWAAVDSLSADAAHSPEVRRILRDRARYEVGNGGYAKGMNKAKAYDLVGKGPRLQLLTGDETVNARIEREWTRWCEKTLFGRTLRTAAKCKTRCGAALLLLSQNSRLPTLAKLKVRSLEIERLHNPNFDPRQENAVDGIEFDAEGNPLRYWILDQHPGSLQGWKGSATAYPAERVLHWFEEDRAEQHHGVSEYTPSLRLFANHRRFNYATIRAAEVAAELAVIFKKPNEQPDPDDGDAYRPEALDAIDLEYGAGLVAPDGYDAQQIKAEHPTANYDAYNANCVTEEGRPLLMPRNIATGNSSGYNYSSGRMDDQLWNFSNEIDRDELRLIVVEPVFEAWLRETLAELSGIAPSDIDLTLYPHVWHWDRRGHVDPQKEANADDIRLRNGSLSFPELFGRDGKDWRVEMTRQAQALGLTLAQYQQLLVKCIYSTPATAPAAKPPADQPDAADPADADSIDQEELANA